MESMDTFGKPVGPPPKGPGPGAFQTDELRLVPRQYEYTCQRIWNHEDYLAAKQLLADGWEPLRETPYAECCVLMILRRPK